MRAAFRFWIDDDGNGAPSPSPVTCEIRSFMNFTYTLDLNRVAHI
jgi:hypothetical protein